ncbi:MAG TPA: DUF3822 family protein [Muribaculum sp.]|jgi:hypothetical protein|uniref:DUF3822 family protein n=1 Tax=Heminiphilus faecis TaxID=2601703 RepID=A0ABV4CXN2_9BACT|nr:DUF3822 family protein [Heminiphilus faecis]RLT75666.1 DUF3822 family protein [bacterium J10(2018)]HRF69519.1 DUF3822 family protein [Muribaculum sp.]
MSGTVLGKDIISEPRMWNLAMRLNSAALDVMLYNGSRPDSLLYRRIPLDTSSLTWIKALEETVYDNPLLLGDFNSSHIIIDTTRVAAVPDEISADTDMQETVADMLLPDDDTAEELIISRIPSLSVAMMMKIPEETATFLRRTFNNPAITHHLTPLCRYFFNNSKLGHTGRVYVNLRQKSLDILAFGNDCLLLANTFEFDNIADAVYYIMACRETLGCSDRNNEVLLAGNAEVREELTPILREYIGYVMPAIFPSTMFKAGKEALTAPFDLIVLPLCE